MRRIKSVDHVVTGMDLEGVRRHEPSTVAGQERDAAVIVPVIERPDGAALLFTKRADHLSDHPGQMSFPGGGREPADADLRETACREAEEEVGMKREELEFVGRLDDIETVTRYSVRPFVARAPDREYVPGDEEVAEVAVLSLADLTDLDNYESERRDHPYYGDIRLHFFYVDGYTVWGATARIFVQFLELATDWEMPPEPDRRVERDADYPT
jgi:8-oxo-dGTP pyrophosphatase MutT (NUDIX family)